MCPRASPWQSRAAVRPLQRWADRHPANQEFCSQVPTKTATAKKTAPSAEIVKTETALPQEPVAASPAHPAPEAPKPDGGEPDPVTAGESAPPATVAGPDEDDEDDTPAPAVRGRAANDSAPVMGHHMMGRPAIAPGGRVMPPPRAMAKAEIFEEGDHVVYPTHGVGKVERIATEEIAGHKLELIHITFEENRMTLRVPVAKARTAGLRKLATRKMFDEAMTVLRGRARIKRTMWSRRAQEYEAKINSGDPLAIAEVVRDLHRNAGQPDQSFSERQIYEAAMDRLAAELAALDRIDKAAAAVKLAEFLKTVV